MPTCWSLRRAAASSSAASRSQPVVRAAPAPTTRRVRNKGGGGTCVGFSGRESGVLVDFCGGAERAGEECGFGLGEGGGGGWEDGLVKHLEEVSVRGEAPVEAIGASGACRRRRRKASASAPALQRYIWRREQAHAPPILRGGTRYSYAKRLQRPTRARRRAVACIGVTSPSDRLTKGRQTTALAAGPQWGGRRKGSAARR